MCTLDFAINRYFFSNITYDLIIKHQPNTFQFEQFSNEEWELVNVASLPKNITFKAYTFNSSGYATNNLVLELGNVQTGFRVNITLRRFPQFYIINVGVPVLVLAAVGQCSFFIPERSDAKLVVPLTVLVGFMFIQSIVATAVPRAFITPSFVLFITSCVLLSGVSSLTCGVLMWIAYCCCWVPHWLSVSIHWLHFLLFPSNWNFSFNPRKCSNINNTSTNNSNNNTIPDSEQGQVGVTKSVCELRENDWQILAAILNRLCAIAHLVVTVILFFILVLPIING